ncbi:4-alpha-glucanotransferase [Thiocapsa roseopersicina]|uniref:4-alpha-glucanotransferase n=1 Tax=Thiocapsa roseopersicina TaxID=1058 RepID=A0A1H2WR73_THIRO|nr:4-alpha-glucanotransferase [Thiocapsa roseopersicina]SDW83065.1 4-alpha-glucanotransferase [Thiocapsa roseopersicina]
MHRTSGILLHPTSLPGPYGIGDLGHSARRFVDFLAAAGQGLWQMLPLGPTGYGESPYQCTSAFAGNPLLISPELLLERGWLDPEELDPPDFSSDQVDFHAVIPWKRALIARAVHAFQEHASESDRGDYLLFRRAHADWLDDFALYHALKVHHGHRPWTEWRADLARREPEALARWSKAHARELDAQRLIQYFFYTQWSGLRAYANSRGVRLIGDMPIFVAHDSSEVWTHREWFQLDEAGHPTVIAGVPPDYFSATGQRWGNPLYDWPKVAADGYSFWVQRLRRVLELVDLVRIDHFRGFAGYWEIPATEETAVNGRWMPGPGMALFDALRATLGEGLPLIAEDLGVITEDVEALRDGLELPGMAILQFGFEDTEGGFGRSSFLPHNHRSSLAVYTGTHDNNTLLGWWALRDPTTRHNAMLYLNSDGSEIHWDFIRSALGSVAALALFPMQDVLGLGAEACMNRPGTSEGNWLWRYREDMLTDDAAERLRVLSRIYGRLPYPG